MTRFFDSRWSEPEVAHEILTRFRVWAVVGCSPDPLRASHGVSRYLISQGFEVLPIYPRPTTVHGLATIPDLRTAAAHRSAEAPIEVVDLFRASHRVRPHVEEAIEIGAKAVWMQLGVWDPESAELADEAGLLVVMNRCPAIDHPALVAQHRG